MFLPGSTIGSANGQAYPSPYLAVKLAVDDQTYQEMILSDSPGAYLRFQESQATAESNIGGGPGNGTIVDEGSFAQSCSIAISFAAYYTCLLYTSDAADE